MSDTRDAKRYRYLRDFPPRARACKDGSINPKSGDCWVSYIAHNRGFPEAGILEGAELDSMVDAALDRQLECVGRHD